ncbi:hypothetical protein [Enterococcus sp. AZ136]|uniref:hypothetical protein n=1 Tax=Enterococcus sp. AZ136 TaxID=2774788 RepID=UPI003D2924D7
MNKKIQNMIEELALECRKEDVTLSLSALDKTGICSLAQVGKNQKIQHVIVNQIEQWEKNAKACGCPVCKRKAGSEEEDLEANDFSDTPDWLARIIRGDF